MNNKQNEQQLLFLIGLPRSGTSLLWKILNQHPDIAIMFEASIYSLIKKTGPLVMMRNRWRQFMDFFSDIHNRHGTQLSKLDMAASPSPEIARNLYKNYASIYQTKIYGEKAIDYNNYISALCRDFPDAKFIILWRSPLNICNSAKVGQQTFRYLKEIGSSMTLISQYDRFLTEVYKNYDPRRFHQLFYEDLVHDKDKAVDDIFSFLKLPTTALIPALSKKGLPIEEIHTNVHSDQVSPKKTAVLITDSEKQLIDQFLERWQQTYQGSFWQKNFPHDIDSSGKISQIHLALMKLTHFKSQQSARFRAIILFFMPLFLWRLYRKIRK